MLCFLHDDYISSNEMPGSDTTMLSTQVHMMQIIYHILVRVLKALTVTNCGLMTSYGNLDFGHDWFI